MSNAMKKAVEVVAKFAHTENGKEWVANPSPDKLRAEIFAAIEQGRADGMREAFEAACKTICPRCDTAETRDWPHHVECLPIRRAAAQMGIPLDAGKGEGE